MAAGCAGTVLTVMVRPGEVAVLAVTQPRLLVITTSITSPEARVLVTKGDVVETLMPFLRH